MYQWTIIEVPTKEIFDFAIKKLKDMGITNSLISWCEKDFRYGKGVLYYNPKDRILARDNGSYFRERCEKGDFIIDNVSLAPEELFEI